VDRHLNWFELHAKKTLLIVVSVCIVVIFVGLEIFLRNFFPFTTGSIGHLNSDNALAYGWGYNPRELMRILDPDTGDVYISSLNNRGWRDKDRFLENKNNSFRIIVLGDSITFGPLVAEDKTYTRILENKLTQEGYNVEVINISYCGWDTGQELEALKREGVRFKPDLVIAQFCTNDLTVIDCLNEKVKPDDLLDKPFCYKLINNKLIKMTNENFYKKNNFYYYLKIIMLNSEVLKRAYYLASIQNKRLAGKEIKAGTDISYSVNDLAIKKFSLVFDLNPDEPVLKDLNKHKKNNINKEELISIITSCNKIHDMKLALRVFEDRWFNFYWGEESFRPKKADPNDCRWKLYLALIKEMHNICEKNGADFAIISENTLGEYAWEVYWGRIENSLTSRDNYLSPSKLIMDFADQEGFGFIVNQHKDTRARNDPHHNGTGYIAFANDVYDFLKKNYTQQLIAHRIN